MKILCYCLLFSIILTLFLHCSARAQEGREISGTEPLLSGEEAASALVKRVTPEYASKVAFSILPGQEKTLISGTSQGTLLISAPNVRECIRAYGYYLRHLSHVHLSWNGDNKTAARFVVPHTPLEVPKALPINFAFNYCAMSYTGIHWNREKWLSEIDRLALNGFSYVLVTAGLEKVWQNFLADIGAASSASSFIANPCFSAWWNMGNLEGEGAPVSQQLIDSEAALGKELVRRIQELGMEPVLQGYVGFLPHDFPHHREYILPQGEWVGESMRPAVLRPDSPFFREAANLWYKNLVKVYGLHAKSFAGDLFHEGGQTEGIDLTACARGVQRAMQDFSPGSVWFLQEWGGNPRKNFLSGTDQEHTVILALEKNLAQNTPLRRDYDGRRYVWCELSNFGANQGLYGGFGILEKASGNAEGASGFGLLSEGLETNPLFYELLYERINNREKICRKDFLERYALARYGSDAPALQQALSLLVRSAYSPTNRREGCPENILCARPSLDARQVSTWSDPEVFYNPEDIRKAGLLLLSESKANPRLMQNSCFRYDLADVCRQVISERARVLLPLCKQAFEHGEMNQFNALRDQFLALFSLSANLLATHEDFLLGRFLQGAAKRAEKGSRGELTRPLLRLITTWTSDISPLIDYSHRQFAELMRSYYLTRWQIFFRTLETSGAPGNCHREELANNGERIVRTLHDDDELRHFELTYPSTNISLQYTPEGDLRSLAEQILHSPIYQAHSEYALPQK